MLDIPAWSGYHYPPLIAELMILVCISVLDLVQFFAALVYSQGFGNYNQCGLCSTGWKG